MNGHEKDETPMLDEREDSTSAKFSSCVRSASLSGPVESVVSSWENNSLGHTGPLKSEKRTPFVQMSGPLYIKSNPVDSYNLIPDALVQKEKTDKFLTHNDVAKNGHMNDGYADKNEHLLKSGQLGMCDDPYCTTCPSLYNYKAAQQKSRTYDIFDAKYNALYGDAKGWTREILSSLYSYVPGVIHPHTKVVQRWNKFFVISCLVAIFVDPLFFFVLNVSQDYKCIVINWALSMTMVVFRSITDTIYLLHMLLQFRLAYVAPESMVVGAGEMVDHPTKIALHYLTGFFLIDLFAVLPVPQVIIMCILPDSLGSSGANYAKNLLRFAILVQYIPRLYRFLPLLAGQSTIGVIFESAWANFVINLLTYVLSGHVVGSCWYLFGLQRVNQCLRDACHHSGFTSCMEHIDCRPGVAAMPSSIDQSVWKNNSNVTNCLNSTGDSFNYGIYQKAVNLVTEPSFWERYIYSLFWGFQQISTLAGNLIPSYFVWEVLFTMAIIGLGLLLFALLIGNMQNFLQSLGRRRLEMSLRRRDVEQWMSHRRLPEDLRRKVREAERYSWAATRGVNEELLMENLPEDLQRNIRRHLFEFVKKIRIFALMDEPILDAICERLRQKTYINNSLVLYRAGVIDKMVFIVRGKMESIGEDGIVVPLSEGGACGEELLTWCLEHSSEYRDGKRSKVPGQRLLSNRMVRCLGNVEAFILKASDLEEVTSLFPRFLRNPRVQGAIRYESPYWRCFAATRIQVAWRYRMKCLNRMVTNRVPRLT